MRSLKWLMAMGILPMSLCGQEVSQEVGCRGDDGKEWGHGDKPVRQECPNMDAWKAADSDGDGKISYAEFSNLPRLKALEDAKKQLIFQRLDKDQDGQLSQLELKHMPEGHRPSVHPMQRLWELDVDRSGGVSLDEFKASKIHAKLPVDKLENLFRRLDTNHDGQISPADRPQFPGKKDGKGGGKRIEGGERPEGMRRDPAMIMKIFDEDHDGKLSQQEYAALPMAKRLDATEGAERFKKIDTNGDGFLQELELGAFFELEESRMGRGHFPKNREGGAPMMRRVDGGEGKAGRSERAEPGKESQAEKDAQTADPANEEEP